MEFPVFVGLAVVAIWLIDQVINFIVEMLLKFSQIIRAISVLLIISFLLGVYYAPELMVNIMGWLMQGISTIAGFFYDVLGSLLNLLPESGSGSKALTDSVFGSELYDFKS